MRITGLDKTIKDLNNVKKVIQDDIAKKKARIKEISDQMDALDDETEELEDAIVDKESTLFELEQALESLGILSTGNSQVKQVVAETDEKAKDTMEIIPNHVPSSASDLVGTLASGTGITGTIASVSKVEEE